MGNQTTGNVVIDLARYRYDQARNEKRLDLIAFRCGETLSNTIKAHCAANPLVSQAMLVSDLVALGLHVYESLNTEKDSC